MGKFSKKNCFCFVSEVISQEKEKIKKKTSLNFEATHWTNSINLSQNGICEPAFTEYMCFNQRGDNSSLSGNSLKLVDNFTYLGSSVSSTEIDINTRLAKAWIAINRLLVIWKSDLFDKIKRIFFQAAVVSILMMMMNLHLQKAF